MYLSSQVFSPEFLKKSDFLYRVIFIFKYSFLNNFRCTKSSENKINNSSRFLKCLCFIFLLYYSPYKYIRLFPETFESKLKT